MAKNDPMTELKLELQAIQEQLRQERESRQEAESALWISEQRLRRIFDYSNDAIFVIDPKGDRILEANPKAAKMLGYSQEELINSVRVSTVHPDEMPQLLAFTDSVLQQGYGWTNELTCLTKSGDKLPAEISASVVSLDGEDCIIALVRDVTERKQAQAATLRLAEIGQLSAMIVHEVRSPLTTVLMGLESFREMELPERPRMRLNLALDEAARLKNLLNEILQFAREQTLDLQNVDLVALIQHLQTTIVELPSVQGHTIQVEASLTEAWIQGDVDKLKQVFINLIRNACEAVDEGETVIWRIDPAPSPGHICISIHNGGEPIPPAIMAELGRPFFTTKPGGNGLGIAIVKRIIDAHQGEFRIESTAEQGTIARVILPVTHLT
jgi:PAS domain S-box-containing protein